MQCSFFCIIRTGISTSNAVQDLISEIITKLNQKQKVIGAFLDISKAFDTVSIHILTDKLERIGVRGEQLSLSKIYFSGRKQYF